MVQVKRKDNKESLENLLRRFNRKVQQAGIVGAVKQRQYFEKPVSKTERRQKAILRKERKDLKIRHQKLN